MIYYQSVTIFNFIVLAANSNIQYLSIVKCILFNELYVLNVKKDIGDWVVYRYLHQVYNTYIQYTCIHL